MTHKLIDSMEGAALTKPAFAGPWLPPIAILTVLAALLAYIFHVILTGGQYQLPGIDATIHYPWEVFTRRALAAGQLPYWNPYFFAGMPHVADVQTIVFYPPAVLLRWLEPGAFLSWQAVSHMWIGGAGTLFLGRVIGISWWASAAAALAVALGGTNAARLHNGHLLVINGTAWLPWALALSIQTVRCGRLGPSPALVLVMMLQFLSGYPQGSLYISAVVCFYFLFSVGWPDSGGSRSNRWRPLAQVLVLSLVALGLSAFQLLPTLGLAAQADRTRGIPFDQASAGAWALADTATFLWPFSGIEVQPAVRFIADRVAYAGWLLTCVGPFALLGKNRRRFAAFCLLLVGLAVAFTLADLPLYRLHHAVFPGLREPGRILFIATLGVAVLGGFGLDSLVEYAQRRQWRRLVLPGAVSMTAVCSAAFVALTHWKAAAVAPVHGWPWIPVVAAVALLVTMIAARAGAVRTALTVALLACAIDGTAYSQGGAHAVGIESDATMRRWVGPSSGGRALSLCENRVDAEDLLMTGVPALRGPVGVRLADYIEWLTLLESTAWPGDTIGERRSASGEQSARSTVHRGPAKSALGRRHNRVCDRRPRKLYLAAILDLFSRFIVGWAVSAVNDRHLAIKALEMALKRRCPDAGVLHHSDQGCTYASADYQRILDTRGITCSMSRRGDCYAVMESFFSSVKSELADRFDSFGEAKMELFDYIEMFYNQRRRHSTLGQISPAAFERRAAVA